MTRPGIGTRDWSAGCVLAAFALLLSGCSSEPTSLSDHGEAHLALQVQATLTTEVVVLRVSGPGLDSTLVFNFPVSAGSATGTLSIPAGSARHVVAQAYDSAGINTHTGDTTVTLVPGTNPALQLRLLALTGGLPITISFGAFALTVTPGDTSVMIGDTVRFRASIIDAYGRPVTAAPLWGTSNLALASVDSSGLATGRLPGTVLVAATYGGAVAFRSLAVNGSIASVGNVDAGDQHACVVTGGRLYCWGDNTYGQLGDGTTIPRAGPVMVALPTAVLAVSAGGAHTCALTADSTAWCWGENGSGQLGDGSTVSRLDPVPVALGAKAGAISAGLSHTCAITAGGNLWCWGRDNKGQLGDSVTHELSAYPVLVGNHPWPALQVDAGDAHTCMVDVTLYAWCWGDNSVGELGDGTTTSRETPVQVAGGQRMFAVSAGGAHSCGLLTGNGLACWGLNASGQLGIGASSGPRLMPVVVMLGLYVGVSAGNSHTCVVKDDGSAACWGDGVSGQVGDGAELPRVVPAAVVGAPPLRQITAGLAFTCGVTTTTGAPLCWGDDAVGQVGDGTATGLWSPEPVGGGVRFAHVAVGLRHACGVTDLGAAFCWGANASGQLGTGSTTLRASPAAVTGGHNFRRVAAGAAHSCGILADSTAWCWGDNQAGQLGIGTFTNSPSPAHVPGIHGVVELQTNLETTCALQADSTLWCWGGRFSRTSSLPQQWGYPAGDLGLAVGGYHECVLGPGLTTSCWGDNSYNQLSGVGLSLTGLSAGARHTCGLASGAAWCWGDNQFGQLGDGTLLPRTTSVITSGSRLISALAAGGDFTCGLTPTGAISCWGANDLGQLGLGTRTPQLWPNAMVSGNYASVAAGSADVCATDATATWCWGDNRYGQLGRGTRSIVPLPVTVRFGTAAPRMLASAAQAPPLQTVAFSTHRCRLGIPFVDVTARRPCR